MKTLVILLGPTAVGKTELSIRMAEHFQCPILSADSRQIYREIPICTAAATPDQQRRVRHYFVGTHGLDEAYSAAGFEQEAISLLSSLFEQHDVLLMTGGSMMYLDAIVKGIDDMPQADPAIRAALKERLSREGLDSLLAELRILDRTYYDSVDQRNPMRVLHGLEMCLTTGRPFSSFRSGEAKQRPFRIVQIGIRRDRDQLDRRIALRVQQMMHEGLVDETRRVYERYQSSVSEQLASVLRNPGPTQAQPIPNLTPVALNTVGLKEMLLHFEGIYSLDRAQERICHNSRIYAKKQMTWFLRNKQINWLDFSAVQHITDETLHRATDFI